MSEVITFDTSAAAEVKPVQTRPEIFQIKNEYDPILREVMPEFDFSNPPMDPNTLASRLVETCRMYRGLGLSANQCGLPYRVFVMGAEDDYVAFFNPKLVSSYGSSHMPEGCLSFPMLMFNITRPAEVEVEYQDYTGEHKTAKFSGMTARIFLHELDHMNGMLYTDHVKPLALKSGVKKIEKLKRNYLKQVKSHGKTKR